MGGVRKPWMVLAGRPVLEWALAPFLARRDVTEVVVALGPRSGAKRLARLDERIRTVPGGTSRFESVANARDGMESDAGVVAVHDGVRPFPAPEVVDACLRVAARGGVGVAGVPAVDTIKRTDVRGRVLETPGRATLWHAQTPQAFPRDLFVRAVDHCRTTGFVPTDDASMAESLNAEVRMVRASPKNLKITHPVDLVIAEALVSQEFVSYAG